MRNDNMLVELKDQRETYGNDETAINKHSVRIYRLGKQVFQLNRTLDMVPPCFDLTVVPYDHAKNVRPYGAIYKTVRVECRERWGDGESWADAERTLMKHFGVAGITRDSSGTDPFIKAPIEVL